MEALATLALQGGGGEGGGEYGPGREETAGDER